MLWMLMEMTMVRQMMKLTMLLMMVMIMIMMRMMMMKMMRWIASPFFAQLTSTPLPVTEWRVSHRAL